MATLFIADLHLDEQRPALTRALLHLLQGEARSSEALYILGDLFEVWVGDDDDSPLARTITQALKALTEAGVPVFLMRGNRDFLIGDLFAANTGVTLLDDPTVIDLYGSKTLLTHGDSLCTKDTQYQTFRQKVRSPQWQADLLGKSLTERRAIARQLRENSLTAKSTKATDIMDVDSAAVVQIMEQHRVQTLIHGHTHRPAIHPLEINNRPAQRYVLGDWGSKSWILRVSADRLSLDSQSIPA